MRSAAATVICVVLLVLTVARYDPEPRHETSGYESRSESIVQSEEIRPGIEFRREVPYREIDLTQSVVERDAGVLDASVQKYGASYEVYIDGQRIDPASYDVHDLRARGYESMVTDYGGYGSVNVTTY